MSNTPTDLLLHLLHLGSLGSQIQSSWHSILAAHLPNLNMARDKRSRSGKPPENKEDSPSRLASTDTTVREPSPSRSPVSAPGPEQSSDHKAELQAGSITDDGKLSQKSETPHDQDVSQASEVPVLTDDGALDSPQIEPGLGEIVEDAANGTPVEYFRSPTNTDQSGSPNIQQPSYNLASELEGVNLGSDEDVGPEGQSEQTSPSAVQVDQSSEGNAKIQDSPAKGNPQESRDAAPSQQAPSKGKAGKLGSNDERPGRYEDSQKETSKRIAAEKQVQELKDRLKAQGDDHERRERKAREWYDREMQKANQARENDKLNLENRLNEEWKQKMTAEVRRYENNLAWMAEMEGVGRSATGDDTQGDDTSLKKQADNANEELAQAIKDEINAPLAGLPIAPRSDLRPGSARFLIAEHGYLLDQNSRLYNALMVTADYADGRGDVPGDEDEWLFNNFKRQLEEMIEFIEINFEKSGDCLEASVNDWEHAAEVGRY